MDFLKENYLFTVNNKDFYRDGDTMVALYKEGTEKSEVMLEASYQSLAEELGILVPSVIEVKKIEKRWALVTSYVGNKLLSTITSNNAWDDAMLSSFVAAELSVHSKKSYDFPKMRDIIHRALGEVRLDGGVRYKLHTTLDQLPKHNKLCHGRMLPTRVIVGDDGNFYIVDWLFAAQGNASAEAAHTYLTLMLDYGQELAERYITVFARKSDVAIDYINRWLPIVAAVMLGERNDAGQQILMKFVK